MNAPVCEFKNETKKNILNALILTLGQATIDP